MTFLRKFCKLLLQAVVENEHCQVVVGPYLPLPGVDEGLCFHGWWVCDGHPTLRP